MLRHSESLIRTRSNKCAPANRRPAGQSDGPWNFVSDDCSRTTSPAAVAELGR